MNFVADINNSEEIDLTKPHTFSPCKWFHGNISVSCIRFLIYSLFVHDSIWGLLFIWEDSNRFPSFVIGKISKLKSRRKSWGVVNCYYAILLHEGILCSLSINYYFRYMYMLLNVNVNGMALQSSCSGEDKSLSFLYPNNSEAVVCIILT